MYSYRKGKDSEISAQETRGSGRLKVKVGLFQRLWSRQLGPQLAPRMGRLLITCTIDHVHNVAIQLENPTPNANYVYTHIHPNALYVRLGKVAPYK